MVFITSVITASVSSMLVYAGYKKGKEHPATFKDLSDNYQKLCIHATAWSAFLLGYCGQTMQLNGEKSGYIFDITLGLSLRCTGLFAANLCGRVLGARSVQKINNIAENLLRSIAAPKVKTAGLQVRTKVIKSIRH